MLLFTVLTTLVTFKFKMITSGVVTCFDRGGHPQAIHITVIEKSYNYGYCGPVRVLRRVR